MEVARAWVADPVVAVGPEPWHAVWRSLLPMRQPGFARALALREERRIGDALVVDTMFRVLDAVRSSPKSLVAVLFAGDLLLLVARRTRRTHGDAAAHAVVAAGLHELRRLECQELCPDLAIGRVAWSGPHFEAEPPEAWLVRLEDGRWAALLRRKKKLTRVVGPLDDALSTIPDAWFAAAARAVRDPG